MKIQFDKEPIVKMTIDMKTFKRKYAKSLDLKASFDVSTEINSVKPGNKDDEETIKRLAFLSMNWSKIITHLHELEDDKKEIVITGCKVSDLVRYSPGIFNAESRNMDFKEEKVKSRDVFITHGIIPLSGHHIETFIANSIFDYVEKKWEREVGAK